MDSSDKPSVNGPFSNNLDDFSDITIWYIGTDASLMELHTELSINTTLKPSDTFIFKYRTQDTSTAEEKSTCRIPQIFGHLQRRSGMFP